MNRIVLVAALALLTPALSACCCPQETPEQKEARKERDAEREKKAEEKRRKAEAKIKKKEKASKHVTDVVVHVEIWSRKDNGKHWDAAKGKPDPMVRLTNKRTGRVRTSKVVKNSRTAHFRFKKLPVNNGDKLLIKVVDKDAAVDDKVGTFAAFFEPNDWQSGSLDDGDIEVEFKNSK
jgi:hypothetical protein